MITIEKDDIYNDNVVKKTMVVIRVISYKIAVHTFSTTIIERMACMLKKNKKEDLRIKKTKKALFSALPVLLSRHKFVKISVHDICTESMVSRTAFYAHFRDKYDFMGQWLSEQKKTLQLSLENKTEQQVEDALVETLLENSTMIVNLLEDADQELQSLFFRFLAPDLYYINSENSAVLADFLAGGIFQVILCHMNGHRKTSQEEFRKTISYIYRMVNVIINWNTAPNNNDWNVPSRQRVAPIESFA